MSELIVSSRPDLRRPVLLAGFRGWNDGGQGASLAAGYIVANDIEPQTLADGARTVSLGWHNWVILKDSLAGIVEVPEENIARAVRLLFELANLKAEPTGALSLAAVLTDPGCFRDQEVCCVISGGNVDPAVYGEILRTGRF